MENFLTDHVQKLLRNKFIVVIGDSGQEFVLQYSKIVQVTSGKKQIVHNYVHEKVKHVSGVSMARNYIRNEPSSRQLIL